ncbi:MAG: hypothetical protein GY947_17315 [Rhodobacteraceae bacterium]|nr:hypothetical protein [Paracoccaceae bacterium]
MNKLSDHVKFGIGNLPAFAGPTNTINGTSGDDDLVGTNGDDSILGFGGNDTITGLRGDDTIDAGEGNNTVYGGSGEDTITAGSGDDIIEGGSGADIIDAGEGNNSIDGGSFDDTITAGSGHDIIEGGSGDDVINAGEGNNSIHGGSFHDTITAGSGDDIIEGGSGNDVIDAGDGNNSIDGGSFHDTITAGSGDDIIDGGSGDDIINAGDGANTIDGASGHDTITSGSGNDIIEAGSGDDVVSAGGGDDSLDGGFGNDTAIFSGSILDFMWTGSSDDLVVTDLNAADGDEGQNIVKDFEVLQFDDFTFNLDGSNHAPLIVDPGAIADEDSPYSFGVSAIDFDGDAMTLDSFTYNGTLGTLTLDSTSAFTPAMGSGLSLNFTFDPGADYQFLAVGDTVVETVSVTVSDGNGGTTVHSFDMTITGLNDGPTMSDGVAAANEDGASVDVDLSVLGDDIDSDDDGTTLIYAVTGAPSEGSAVISGTTLTFDPGSDFQHLALGETVDVTITVQATDSHGATTTADITVTVTGANDGPTMTAGFADATEDGQEITVDLAALGDDVDSDDNGASLTYTIIGAPSDGTASISGTTLTFDPGSDFQELGLGETVDVTITVQVTDSHGATTTEDVTVTVTGINDAPVAQDDSLAVDEADGPIVIDLKPLVSDVDVNDILSLSLVSIFDTGSGRALSVPFTLVDGVLTIDPSEFGLNAGDMANLVLTYQVSDDSGLPGGTVFGEIDLTVTGSDDEPTPNTNNAPVAVDQLINADEADGLIVIDLNNFVSDPDTGDVLTITAVSFISDGRTTPVVFSIVNGVVTIDPAQFGLDEGESLEKLLQFTVDDGSGTPNNTATGFVTLVIEGADDTPDPTNSAPVADDLTMTVNEVDGVFDVDLNGLVSDPDTGDVLSITSIVFSTSSGNLDVVFGVVDGVVSIDPVQFNLDDGETMTGFLTFVVDDGTGTTNSTDTGVVTFTVNGFTDVVPPDPPETEVLFDFEPYSFDFAFQGAIDLYEGFRFSTNAQVFETDEMGDDGRGGVSGIVNGSVSTGDDNVLVSQGDEDLKLYGRGTSLVDEFIFGEEFDLESAYMTGAWNDGMTVTVTGYTTGTDTYGQPIFVEIGSQSFTVGTSGAIFAEFDDAIFDSVVMVNFSTSGGTNAGLGGTGTQLVLDDILLFV